MTLDQNASPVEVWLSKRNLNITCRVVYDNEAVSEVPVRSLSMRGAQREITGWLIDQGYEPVGRWSTEEEHGFETMRRFRRPGLKRPLMPNPGEFTRFNSYAASSARAESPLRDSPSPGPAPSPHRNALPTKEHPYPQPTTQALPPAIFTSLP